MGAIIHISMGAITFIGNRHLSVANRSHQVIASTGHFFMVGAGLDGVQISPDAGIATNISHIVGAK